LRTFAGLEKDVVLVGMGKRIEIWSAEQWTAMEEGVDMNAITEAMADLGLIF
jgi:MraZ protein